MDTGNNTNWSDNFTEVPPYIVTVEQWILYGLFLIFFALVSILENSIVVILVVTDKKLHGFFFVIIAGHSLGLIVWSFGHLIVSVSRLIPAYWPNLIRMSRLLCHSLNILVYTGPSFSSISMLILALDRTYAVYKPLQYQNRPFEQGLIVSIAALLFTLFVKLAPSYSGQTSLLSEVTCVTSRNGVSEEWWVYNYWINDIFTLITLILYLILLRIAMIRTEALHLGTFSNDQMANRLLKKQLKLLRNISLLVVVNFFVVIPYSLLLTLSNYVGPNLASKLVLYGACLCATDMIIEPTVLILNSSEIKCAAFNKLSKVRQLLSINANSISNLENRN